LEKGIMKLILENWRKYINEEEETFDWAPALELLKRIDPKSITRRSGIEPREVSRELRTLLGPDFIEELADSAGFGDFEFPQSLLEANIEEKSLKLYRGTSGQEWREAMTGKVTHRSKPSLDQWGGEVKYMTTDLEYAQHGRWGDSVISYNFNGKLLGHASKDSLLWGYISTLGQALGELQEKIASLCDGVYGDENAVPRVVTYGIFNMDALAVDIEDTKRLKNTPRENYL
jgi:hypothetical protein